MRGTLNVRNLTKERMMTTIGQHSQYATLINVFVVEPGRAADLAALLEAGLSAFGVAVAQIDQEIELDVWAICSENCHDDVPL